METDEALIVGNPLPSVIYDVSVIVPVVERYDSLKELYSAYADEIVKITDKFEFIFIIDGHMKEAFFEIKEFANDNPHIKFILFPRKLGESNALSAGLEKASGRYVFTLSSYFQVEPFEIHRMYEMLVNNKCDMVISKRIREDDSFFNKLQTVLFHKILNLLTGSRFSDISCGLRGMTRKVLKEFDIYGDLHRFIPILAEEEGFTIKEIPVKQSKKNTKTRVYRFKTYFNRLIDIATLFFLLRFTYRPMRFFGLLGSLLILMGGGMNLYLIYKRLFTKGFGLIDKPSLFLSSLLIVIGIQVFAIGLIGEILIYTHRKKGDHFKIKELIE